MMSPEEIKEAIEHRDVLLDIRAILATTSGRGFFKYIFKHFEIGELPDIGLDGNILMDKLGSLRAGRALFALVAEADATIAGALLAQKEKDSYAERYEQQGIGQV